MNTTQEIVNRIDNVDKIESLKNIINYEYYEHNKICKNNIYVYSMGYLFNKVDRVSLINYLLSKSNYKSNYKCNCT
jgi:hypothetical protein